MKKLSRGGSFDRSQEGDAFRFRGRVKVGRLPSSSHVPGCPSFGLASKSGHGGDYSRPGMESAEEVQEKGEARTKTPGSRVDVAPRGEEVIESKEEMEMETSKEKMKISVLGHGLRSVIVEVRMGLSKHSAQLHEFSHAAERATRWLQVMFEE